MFTTVFAAVPGDKPTEEIPQVLRDNKEDIQETQATLRPEPSLIESGRTGSSVESEPI